MPHIRGSEGDLCEAGEESRMVVICWLSSARHQQHNGVAVVMARSARGER